MNYYGMIIFAYLFRFFPNPLYKGAGHDFIFNISEALCKENVTISSADLFVRLKEYLNLKYNWINEDNLYRLMSQGCYYAYKEGYDGALN